ncbi:MAG TPA: methyltransferase [Candidatus Hydrogenedentes bacterium]|mgnify:FL=1|nr:methyltransferase [Candidatus Hydrogenedentota bacterium]
METWTPENLLASGRSFMDSRVLLTAVELDLFSLLDGSEMTLEEVIVEGGLSSRGAAILLDGLAALGLLEKRGGRYAVAPAALPLSSRHPQSVLPMMRHTASLWHRWSELTAIVRTGKGSERPAGAFDDPQELEAFIGAMHVVGREAAAHIARVSRADGSRSLLDVGGATGTYAEAFLREYPAMKATVFDRPPVIEMARRRLEPLDIWPRVTLAAGDFYRDYLPGGHDLVLLSAIIHQNSPEQNVDLYRKCFDALVPGGRILIRDHVLNADRTQPASGALFALNMLACTNGGNCYTLADITETLERAGFARVALLQDGDRMDGLVEAFKP